MASSIDKFLKIKPRKKKTKTVGAMIQGEHFEFDIVEVEPKLISEIYLANAVSIPSSVQGGPSTESTNSLNVTLDVCEQGIVGPDLHDVTLQNQFKALNPRDLLYNMFKHDLTSLADLSNEIIQLSMDDPDSLIENIPTSQEDVEKAKN